MLNRALLLTEDPLDVWSLLGMEYAVENFEAASNISSSASKSS